MDSQSLTRYFPASRLTVTATLMLSLTALTRPANAAFILQFSELETNDNGSLFADTIAAKGSPVGAADISDPTKTPYGIVLSAPGTQPTSLPGYIPRLCGNENGNISGIAVSTTCRVSIELAPNAIAQADDLKAGIAYLVEPPGQPDAGDVSDSLQVVLGAGDVATGRRSSIDFSGSPIRAWFRCSEIATCE